MNLFLIELKFAILALRYRIGFAMTIILTLGVTLGALITMFALNHTLLVKPLPYPKYDRLVTTNFSVAISDKTKTTTDSLRANLPGLEFLYKNQTQFTKLAIFGYKRQYLTDHSEQPYLKGQFSSPEYFELLNVPLYKGRFFSDKEGLGTKIPNVVLSYDTWKTYFNAEEDIIGRNIQLDSVRYTVIGITAKDFKEPDFRKVETNYWVPWEYHNYTDKQKSNWGDFKNTIGGLGLLSSKQNKTVTETTLSSLINNEFQQFNNIGLPITVGINLVPLKTLLVGDSKESAIILLISVIGLLLIACVNITNMFFSRATEKQHNLAIQAAMGAKRKQIYLSIFVECLILTSLASAFSLIVAKWGIELLQIMGSDHFNRLDELDLTPPVLIFTFAISICLSAIFAYLSNGLINYQALKKHLQNSGKGSGLQISKKSRSILVISQVALASLLLSGSTVILEKSLSIINYPLGFNSENIISIELYDKSKIAKDKKNRQHLISTIENRLTKMPQITHFSPSTSPPSVSQKQWHVRDSLDNTLGVFQVNQVSSNYFEAIQVPLVSGRTFTKEEVRDGDNVALVSRSAAKLITPDGNAIGKRIYYGPPKQSVSSKIIGIVDDIYSPGADNSKAGFALYTPYDAKELHFLARVDEGQTLTKRQLISALQEIDPQIRILDYSTVREIYKRRIKQSELIAGISTALAFLALTLTSIGVYGVLSYSAQMRKYEMGVRMAIGAKMKQVRRLVIVDSMTPIGLGLLISTIASFFLYWWAYQNFEVLAETKGATLLICPPIILLITLVACYFPVEKIIKNDPIKALRNE